MHQLAIPTISHDMQRCLPLVSTRDVTLTTGCCYIVRELRGPTMTEANTETTGRCQCGHVRFSYTAPESWACYCHCDDCRRNCAAPLVAFIGVPLDGFAWHMSDAAEAPKFYPSSPGVKRFFCDHCGTPMAFQAEIYAGAVSYTHLTLPTN